MFHQYLPHLLLPCHMINNVHAVIHFAIVKEINDSSHQ